MDFNIDAIAELSKIDLTDEERASFSKDFEAILSYIDRLQEVDTSQVKTAEYLLGDTNVFREDVVDQKTSEISAVIDAFPKKTNDALEVPAVFE